MFILLGNFAHASKEAQESREMLDTFEKLSRIMHVTQNDINILMQLILSRDPKKINDAIVELQPNAAHGD